MRKINLFLLGLLGLHLFFLVNIQFTAWPEMFSFPYLLNNGFNIYKDMVHAYPPLLTLLLGGVYKIFGYNPVNLQVLTWTLILVSDVMIFLNVRSLTGKSSYAFGAVLLYVLTQPFLDGNMLWFDTALTLPVLLAFYFRKKLFLAGIFLAIALLIKQTALVYIGVFLAYLIYSKSSFKDVSKFLFPIIFSLLLFTFWLITSGSFVDFYNWNFYYPATIWTKYPSYEIFKLNRRELLSVLLILFPGFITLLFKFKQIIKDEDLTLLSLLLLASILAVYPRFSFYHFQPALAISAIVFGVTIKYLKLKLLVLGFYFLIIVLLITFPLLKLNWHKEVRFWSKDETNLANIIATKVNKDGTVYLLGSQSAHYVMANRLPPKPWLDNFGWYFEVPGVQEKTISLWEKFPPHAVMVQDPIPGPLYQIGTYQPKMLMDWIGNNYNRVEEISSGIWLWERKK